MMRVRLIAVTAAVAAAALVLVVFGTGAGDDHEGDYKVRAIFSSAFTVIPGEDVKISGVKVGKISALDVTPDNKAAVVLDITEPGFKDFRKDATCTIRPQSLIGERFVECTPTQPRAEGDAAGARARQDRAGRGQGRVPAARLPDDQADRPRPRGQHHAVALPPAALDHHQRARHRPGRQRGAAARGGQGGQPGPSGDRQGPEDPRRPERDARPAGQERRRGPAPAGPRQGPGRRLHRQGRQDGGRQRGAPQRHRGEPAEAPALPDASSSRRCSASAAWPTR